MLPHLNHNPIYSDVEYRLNVGIIVKLKIVDVRYFWGKEANELTEIKIKKKSERTNERMHSTNGVWLQICWKSGFLFVDRIAIYIDGYCCCYCYCCHYYYYYYDFLLLLISINLSHAHSHPLRSTHWISLFDGNQTN